MKYFYQQNDAITATAGYEVVDILYREDNNFLEGFYYDVKTDSFYESSGLYGKSYVHRLSYDPSSWTLSIDQRR